MPLSLDKITLIGCSPSSGSTAITARLNNIVNIFGAPELCIFGNGGLFSNVSEIDSKILEDIFKGDYSSRLKLSNGNYLKYNPYPAINESNFKAIGTDFKSLGTASISLEELFNHIFNKHDEYDYIVEKSPSNIWALPHLKYTGINYIHIIRNGYYAISSMKSRGIPLMIAATIWVIENYLYKCLSERYNNRNLLIKYEEFFSPDSNDLEKIYRFITGTNNSPIIQKKEYLGPSKLNSWTYNIDESIQKTNPKLKLTKAEIELINKFKIAIPTKIRDLASNQNEFISFIEVMNLYNYELQSNAFNVFSNLDHIKKLYLDEVDSSSFKGFVFRDFLKK